MMPALRIIQTTDLHNRLSPQKAERLRTWRLERRALLLDCGDAIWAGNVFVKPGPERAIRLMNEAGYDAMALGNREFFFRSRGLVAKTRQARFPALCANLVPAGGDARDVASAPLGQVRRWASLTAPDGSRVGVFGLMPTMIRPGSWLEAFSDLRFFSPQRATAEAVAALREGSDWLVCLSHVGLEAACELAEEFPALDLILGGHSHLDDLRRVGGVTLSHVSAWGRHVALLTSDAPARPCAFTREEVPLP